MCVCERERVRDRDSETERDRESEYVCMCVCVCVCLRQTSIVWLSYILYVYSEGSRRQFVGNSSFLRGRDALLVCGEWSLNSISSRDGVNMTEGH